MSSAFNSDIRELLVLAVTLSVLLAQDKSETEIAKMGAFFTIMGDVLELFALQPELFHCCQSLCEPSSNSLAESEAGGTQADT